MSLQISCAKLNSLKSKSNQAKFNLFCGLCIAIKQLIDSCILGRLFFFIGFEGRRPVYPVHWNCRSGLDHGRTGRHFEGL